jgi:hypothetical protein
MAPFVHNETIAYVALGLIAIYKLPAWGRSVLAFLRDVRKFPRRTQKVSDVP